MADQDGDQDNLESNRAAPYLAQRIAALQDRAQQEGFVSDGSDSKPMMDEGWGEDCRDPERPAALAMTEYPDQELLRRIALEVAEAWLLVEGFRRQAAQSAQQIALSHAALAQTANHLDTAQKALSQMTWRPRLRRP
jgi:hypothetical protein